MAEGNGRWIGIFTGCAASLAAGFAMAAFYQMTSRASESDVVANSVRIASQDMRLAAQEVKLAAQEVKLAAITVLGTERSDAVDDLGEQVSSIDRALNILVEGYRESK